MAFVSTNNLKTFADGFAKKIADIFAKKTDIPESLPADGGDARTVNGHTVEADVPADATFSDTRYGSMKGATDSAAGAAGLVPAPAQGKQGSFLRGDGEWAEMAEASDSEIDKIIDGTFS